MLFTGLLVLSVVQLLNANSISGIYEKAQEKCLRKYSLKSDQLESTLEALDNLPNNIKCFLHCFFEQVGMMDNLEINGEFLKALIEEELRMVKDKELQQAEERYLNTCIGNIKEDDKCEKAFAFYKCIGHRYYEAEPQEKLT